MIKCYTIQGNSFIYKEEVRMKKKWVYNEIDAEKVKELQSKYQMGELLASVLVGRNIIDEEEIKVFLDPTRNDFYDPFLMPDMEVSVNRIIKAIEQQEKTIIYGDYDVDGITSIAVLKQFLADRGLEVDYYIPNRLDEGYGLNKDAIKEIADKGYTLMITVDCGISGIEEVEYANSLGIETIITDHHEPLDVLPNSLAVMDAKIKTNQYPFNQLAGVGVVFKLTQAISRKLEIEDKEYLKYLDLVCIGTISDIVPLVDENRVIAKLGLKLVEVTKNIGLKMLLQSIGYKKINSMCVSFGIAPRINACGRMGHAEEALKLFLTHDIQEAAELTEKLNRYNIERQTIERKIYEEAIQHIEAENINEHNSIVVGGDGWHHGVIGIVASKITDMYYKPSILVCFEGNDGKGSGRSIMGFDLHKALGATSTYLEKYGGHAMAVGVTLKKDNFTAFQKAFEEYVAKQEIDKIVPIIHIDKLVSDRELQIDNVKELEKLEPFGEANKSPLMAYKNLKIDSIRVLTEGKHMKLTLKSENNNIINAIGFNMGYRAEEFLIGDKVDIVGILEVNSFNGRENVQFNLQDIMKSI